jgi:hypothetical protein
MKVGDMVRVIRGRDDQDPYGEVIETHPNLGFCYVRFLDDWESECDGSEETYCFDELEVVNESR